MPDAVTRESDTTRDDAGAARLVVGLIVVLGIMLRLLGIARESPWYDEVLSLRALQADTLGAYWEQLAKEDPAATLAPVYFTLEYLWAALVGADVLSVRLLSVALGTLMIPLLYAVGRKLASPLAGCVASLCLSMSLVHIFYAQEIRMYALAGVLVLLSVLTLLNALEKTQRACAWWTIHAAVNGLMLWTHAFTVFLLAVEGVFLLLRAPLRLRQFAAWCGAQVLVAAPLAGWIALMSRKGATEGAFWPPLPGLRDMANSFLVFAGGRFSNEDPTPYMGTHLSLDRHIMGLYFLVGAWMGLWGLHALARRKYDTQAGKRIDVLLFLGLWLFVPPLALAVMSYVYRPCFMYRYVLYASLALYLIMGSAMASMRRPFLAGLIITLITIIYTHQIIALPLPFRPDYRSAASIIEASGTPLDHVITFKEINALPFLFAADIPKARHESIHGFRELCATVAAKHRRGWNVWVVMWRWDDTEAFEEYLNSKGFGFADTKVGGMPRLRLYYVRGGTPPDGPVFWET